MCRSYPRTPRLLHSLCSERVVALGTEAVCGGCVQDFMAFSMIKVKSEYCKCWFSPLLLPPPSLLCQGCGSSEEARWPFSTRLHGVWFYSHTRFHIYKETIDIPVSFCLHSECLVHLPYLFWLSPTILERIKAASSRPGPWPLVQLFFKHSVPFLRKMKMNSILYLATLYWTSITSICHTLPCGTYKRYLQMLIYSLLDNDYLMFRLSTTHWVRYLRLRLLDEETDGKKEVWSLPVAI